jgi:hypothetical protein
MLLQTPSPGLPHHSFVSAQSKQLLFPSVLFLSPTKTLPKDQQHCPSVPSPQLDSFFPTGLLPMISPTFLLPSAFTALLSFFLPSFLSLLMAIHHISSLSFNTSFEAHFPLPPCLLKKYRTFPFRSSIPFHLCPLTSEPFFSIHQGPYNAHPIFPHPNRPTH